jgi:hypothetical protein
MEANGYGWPISNILRKEFPEVESVSTYSNVSNPDFDYDGGWDNIKKHLY